jgi:hypothetical protein
MKFKSQLDSTRFFYVQEGLAVGVLGAIAKTFLPTFPVLELYSFVAPIVGLAFGLKTWGSLKENGIKPKDNELPIR